MSAWRLASFGRRTSKPIVTPSWCENIVKRMQLVCFFKKKAQENTSGVQASLVESIGNKRENAEPFHYFPLYI